ncbi:MAG TPA: DUF1080 domain-containing protein [Chitinophagaceae bacterium]|nr:DUF1080 domain-containing protein [Chitinophagaceae bacterium]
MLQKLFIAAVIVSLSVSCNSPKQTAGGQLTNEEKNNGWKLLFDGKTTNGWHRYGRGAIDSVWKVKDGILCLDTMAKKEFNIKGDWDIVTDDEYENFDLQLEWKISKDGNSGIIFYIHEDKKVHNWPWETGMEMQVLDNNGHPDAKFPKHRAGDLYDLISCSKETVKPYDEWNLAEVKCINGKLDLYLNRENVVSTTLWDDNWRKMVAGSKFRNMTEFGTYKKGRIGLQDHGNEVCFRNIKIRKL